MNRRQLIEAMLGTAALTALPSEVWPFKKIFLPPEPKLWGRAVVKPWIEFGWVTDITFTTGTRNALVRTWGKSGVGKLYIMDSDG